MSYATPFERYVAPALARPQIWRVLLGLVLVGVFWVGSTVGVVLGAAWVLRMGGHVFTTRDSVLDWMMTSPAGVLTLLATFAGLALGVLAAAKLLHGRGPGTLTGRGAQFVRDFLMTAGIMLGLALPLTVVTTPWDQIAPGLAPARWLVLLPLTVLGVGLQTLSEELLFRGYLLQQMAARFRWRLAWMVLPSLGFALLHASNPGVAPQTLLPMLVILFIFALAAADLTAVSGGLGAAWGFHFANNFMVIGVLSSGETLNGLALWHGGIAQGSGAAVAPSPLELAANAALVIVVWWLCRRAVRR